MKKLIISLIVFALAGSASARVYYSDGGVHNFTTQTHESIGIENGTTINIGDSVVVTLTREAHYSTSYVGSYYGTGPTNYLNLSGSGQLLFSQEMHLSIADGTEAGVIDMSGTSYMNPSGLSVGQRGDSLFSITDDATLELRADGTLYTPAFNLGNNHYGYDLTGTFDQSGNATVLSVGSGLNLGSNNTGIYNMSGGTLTLGGTISGAGADDAFNFSGGVITLLGGDYTSIIDEDWFFGAASATFDGTDTTIVVPEPMTICLLGLGGLLIRRKR